MRQEMKIVAYTCETESNKEMNERLVLLSGKAAGVCYMPDNYMEEGIQNTERALKRAENTAKSGHHSVFDHGHITMLLKTNKMMAMLLNSIGAYNTSEKSARYTIMHPDTDLELTLYEKWREKLAEIIQQQYPQMEEKMCKKLAMENARYMISVFTPTVMEYTVSFRMAFLVADYLEKLCRDCEMLSDSFSRKLKESASALAVLFRQQLGKTWIHDNKNQGFRLLEYQNVKQKITPKKEVIGDSYTLTYTGSLAMLAQVQRHRTLHYTMFFEGDCSKYGFYVPPVIEDADLTEEWLRDMEGVAYCFPQGTLVRITEQGIFEDFALKCKERLCGRAQLEVTNSTESAVWKFLQHKQNLSEGNRKILDSMTIDGQPCARCMFPDFICTEGCQWGGKEALTRLI